MGRVCVGKVADVPAGGVKVVEAGDEEVLLCNVDGAIYAMANVCTHDDGPLGEGELLDHQIECPRHGARFDVRTGEVRSLPAIVPVPMFEVQIEDGLIWVDVD